MGLAPRPLPTRPSPRTLIPGPIGTTVVFTRGFVSRRRAMGLASRLAVG
jgi:hypothetical protein